MTFGFPALSEYRYRLGAKEDRLGLGGVRALRLLDEIVRQAPSPGDMGWLLPLRSHIKDIEQINPITMLHRLVTGSPR